MHPMVQPAMPGGIKVEQDVASDHGIEIKTNPATPIKAEENSVSSGRGSTHEE